MRGDWEPQFHVFFDKQLSLVKVPGALSNEDLS